MKLVDNWRKAPRWLSMQFAAGLGIWLALPGPAQAAALAALGVAPATIPGLLVVGIIVGRLVEQPRAK